MVFLLLLMIGMRVYALLGILRLIQIPRLIASCGWRNKNYFLKDTAEVNKLF